MFCINQKHHISIALVGTEGFRPHPIFSICISPLFEFSLSIFPGYIPGHHAIQLNFFLGDSFLVIIEDNIKQDFFHAMVHRGGSSNSLNKIISPS